MPRESKAAKVQRAADIERVMFDLYGEGACSLDYTSPFQLTCAVVLSAQCTDAAVNKVTPKLFASYPTPEAMAAAKPQDVEAIIHTLGFFRAKAKNLVALAQKVCLDFGGQIPQDVDALQTLPGVGRKTANLVCGDIYGKPAVVTDTHCIRISNRLGLVDTKDPYKVETALRQLLPPEESNAFCHRLVLFGREVCSARSPACSQCPLQDCCADYQKTGAAATA